MKFENLKKNNEKVKEILLAFCRKNRRYNISILLVNICFIYNIITQKIFN